MDTLFVGQHQTGSPNITHKRSLQRENSLSKAMNQNLSYEQAIKKAKELEQYKEGAMVEKRKREIIDRALKIVENKGKAINQMLGSKEMKEVFEQKYAGNKFQFNYHNNPQIKSAGGMQPSQYQQNPYLYQYQMQQHYQQLHYQQQLELERIKQQQLQQQQQAAQEALDQLKIMQLEPLKQLRELQTLQEKLQGVSGSDPQRHSFVSPYLNNLQNRTLPLHDQQQYLQTQVPLGQSLPPLPPQNLDYSLPLINNDRFNSQVYNHDSSQVLPNPHHSTNLTDKQPLKKRPQSHNNNILIQEPLVGSGQDYMDKILNYKYQPSQHQSHNIRELSDAYTIQQQSKEFQLLDQRKRRLLHDFQNLRKQHDYRSKVRQHHPQLQPYYQQLQKQGIQQDLVKQGVIVQQQIDLQTSMLNQQQLIQQLMASMNESKQDQVKDKNKQILSKIKKYERKNKQMQSQLNRALLMQLSGNPNNQMNGLEHLLLQDEDQDSESDLDV